MPARRRIQSSGRPFIVGLILVLVAMYVVSVVYRPYSANSELQPVKGFDPYTDEMPASRTLDRTINRIDILRQARIAAREGRTDDIKLLIQQGFAADTNVGERQTILMLACLNGHADLARYLLSQGASASAVDVIGNTPLSAAVENGHVAIVDLLLKADPDLHIDTPTGPKKQTPLVIAAENGHSALTKYLVTHGANVNLRDNYGNTALIGASLFAHLDIVRYLIANHADVNAADIEKMTTFYNAQFLGQNTSRVGEGHPYRTSTAGSRSVVTFLSPAAQEEQARQRRTLSEIITVLKKASAHE